MSTLFYSIEKHAFQKNKKPVSDICCQGRVINPRYHPNRDFSPLNSLLTMTGRIKLLTMLSLNHSKVSFK